MQSKLRGDGVLEVSLVEVASQAPGPDDIVVRVEAAPINPSDLGLLFGPADMTTASTSGTPERPVLAAKVPPGGLEAAAARIDQALPVGNEGAGIVIEAGSSDAAQALMGRTVAVLGGAMYSQFRSVPAAFCLPLPEGTTPVEGASCFVNPLTALGMVETMRLEEHTALVHTAAASNLGQMLNKLCLAEDVPLVNIVRKPEQAELLRGIGAKHVCSSSEPGFMSELTDALAETGATLAFDATGGGRLASQVLACMERAASRNVAEYSRYGSATHKQVYIYGGLDPTPTELQRSFGMAWGVGGWLLPLFLRRIGPAKGQELRERVAREIKTTFASTYTKHVSLAEALGLEAVRSYGRMTTGEKYLIDPSKGL